MTDHYDTPSAQDVSGFVSVRIGDQSFGVPVLQVQDVIAPTPINVVPLSPPEVAGSLNLRGRIVTAIDLRRRLAMPEPVRTKPPMSVIVERAGELYAFLVDDVGEVLWLSSATFEPTPVTVSQHWRNLCDGLYRLEGELLLVLNVERVLALNAPSLAA